MLVVLYLNLKPITMRTYTHLVLSIVLMLTFITSRATVINVPADHGTIQAAIDAAQSGDTILLANGTYTENISIRNKNLVIASAYINTLETNHISATILKSAATQYEAKAIIDVSGVRTYTLKLVGITIQDGFNTQSVRISGYNTTIEHSVFENNGGGGIYIIDGDARITKSTFTNNTSYEGFGGAIYLQMSNEGRSIQIDSSTFTNNNAAGYGGAIYSTVYKSELKIIGNTITGGTSNRGGAIGLSLGAIPYVKVQRNVIYGNSANVEGGAIYIAGRSCRLTNNTIVNNRLNTHSSNNKGAAIYIKGTNPFTYFTLTNNIVRNNATEATDTEVYLNFTETSNNSEARISYCNIDENASNYASANTYAVVSFLEGNITSNPLFVDEANNNYSLQQTSPCIDAGSPDVLGDGANWETDPDDQDPDGTRLDIGAIPYIDLTPKFEADFTFAQIDSYAPSEVQFKDASKAMNLPAITSWSWNFGDGTTSTEKNPTHSYTEAGTYTVSLTISNGANQTSKTATDAITVLGTDDGFYTELINLPMEQTLVSGKLTGYSESGIPITIARAIYPDFTELDGDPIFTSNGTEYWGHQARFEFDLSAIEGQILEVAAEVIDNNGGSMLVVYSNATAILNTMVGCAETNNCVKSQWFVSRPESNQQPTRVIFSSFEGAITTLRLKVKKEIPQPVLGISTYSPTCSQFMFTPTLEHAPSGDISYKWFINDQEVSQESSYSNNFDAGQHTICLKAYTSQSPETPFAEKCETFTSENITAHFTHIYYPVEKRIVMVGKATSQGPVTYNWTLGDGNYRADATIVNYTYTTNGTYYPTFVATSTANPGCFANHAVEIVVEDVTGGDNCENNSITGVLETGIAAVNLSDFRIELLKLQQTGAASQQATNEINTQTGEFAFTNLPNGEYILRATIANPENYPQILVSYFNQIMDRVVLWQEASPITLTCNTAANLNLTLASIAEMLSGNGTISGLVTYATTGSKENSVSATQYGGEKSYSGALLYLVNKANNSVVAKTTSGSNGSYSFSNVAEGNYEVLVEIPGLAMSSTHAVEISAASQTVVNRNFIVNLASGVSAVTTFTIDATAGSNGSISPSGTTTVQPGATHSVTITPNTGYHTMDVMVDGSSIGAVSEHTFTNVVSNHTINASFAINTYSVLYSVVGSNGTLSAEVNSATIQSNQSADYGSTIIFTAAPAQGYRVKEWKENGTTVAGNTTNSYTHTNLTEALNVTVEFEVITGVDSDELSAISIYPNPFTDSFVIENAEKVSHVTISNLIGQVVTKRYHNGQSTLRIETTNLKSGIYLVSITLNNGQKVVKKVIKK